MNPKEYIEKAKENKTKLRNFVAAWHPINCRPHKMKITADTAESACQHVREDIIAKSSVVPIERQFDIAVETEDASKLDGLLNQAWFGVPESTECWQIEGFREAVNLMEDPPEYDALEG